MFATLHTDDAAQAVDRISDVFPSRIVVPGQVQFLGHVCWQWSPTAAPEAGGPRRGIGALDRHQSCSNLVREGNTHQLRNVMHGSRAAGMQTLESGLNDLVVAGIVSTSRRGLDARCIRTRSDSGPRLQVVGAT